jgi:hypothetical protein
MWSTSVGGHLMKVVNLTGFTVIGAVVKQYSLPFLMSCGLILNLYSAVLVKFAPVKTSIWKLFFVIFQLLFLGLAY